MIAVFNTKKEAEAFEIKAQEWCKANIKDYKAERWSPIFEKDGKFAVILDERTKEFEKKEVFTKETREKQANAFLEGDSDKNAIYNKSDKKLNQYAKK